MAEFTSSPQVSSFPDQNILYNSASGITAQGLRTNDLLNQGRQLDLSNANMEQVSRVAAALRNIQDPAERAAAYPRYVGMLQSQGYAMHAPATLPDDRTLELLAAQGVSSKDQLQHQADIAANNAIVGGSRTGTGTGTATAAAPSLAIPARGTGGPGASASAPPEWLPYFEEASKETGIPVDLLIAQARQESGFNPTRPGTAGEIGLFQIKPSTAAAPAGMAGVDPASITGPENVRNNILFGARYLKAQMGGGDPNNPAVQAAALHRYNGGGDPDYVAHVFRYRPGMSPTDPSAAITTYTPPSTGAATATAQPATAPAGGGGTPGSYQVASTAPVAPPGSTASPDAQWDLPGAPAPDQPPVPAAPATTAAAPPAATTAPAAPYIAPMPTPPVYEPNGFTTQQNFVLDRLRNVATPDKIVAVQNGFRDDNRADIAAYNARLDRHHTDVRQADQDARQARQDAQALKDKAEAAANAAANLRLSQESGQRDAARLQLSEAAERRAVDDATAKAKAAGRPLQGNDIDAQHENYLYEHANEIRDKTAPEDVQRQYEGSYYALQQKGGQAATMTDPNNPGSQIPVMLTRRLPPSLPEPPGGALPLVMASPGASKQEQMTVEQGKSATYASRMITTAPMMEDLDEKALTWGQSVKEKAGNFIGYNLNSPDYKNLRVAQEAFLSGVIRKDSGAAVGADEWTRYAHVYFPMPGDDHKTVEFKRHLRDIELQNMKREAGPNWKPPEGLTGTKGATPDKPRKPLSAFD